MKWWLICDEDIDKIRNILNDVIYTAIREDEEKLNDALHTFDTGLHKTDCIPDDFREKPIVSNGLIGG